jgi:hypothetical protein
LRRIQPRGSTHKSVELVGRDLPHRRAWLQHAHRAIRR